MPCFDILSRMKMILIAGVVLLSGAAMGFTAADGNQERK